MLNQKGFLSPVIILVGLVLIIGVVVITQGLYGKLYLTSPIGNSELTQNLGAVKNKFSDTTQKPTYDPTLNWQRYTSPNVDWEIKFPTSLNMIINKSQSEGDIVSFSCELTEDCGDWTSNLFTIKEVNYSTISEYLNRVKPLDHKDISLNGISSEVSLIKDPHNSATTFYPNNIQYFIPGIDKGYLFTYRILSNMAKLSEGNSIADIESSSPKILRPSPDIVSTFRLLPKNQTQGNTSEFVDAKYNFAFTYPSDYFITEINSIYLELSNKKKGGTITFEMYKDSDGSQSSFSDLAFERASLRCVTDGVNGGSDCGTKAASQQSLQNKDGLIGYKLFLNFTGTNLYNDGKNIEQVIGPVYSFDVSKQTNNTVRVITISLEPFSQVGNKNVDTSAIDIIGNSLHIIKK